MSEEPVAIRNLALKQMAQKLMFKILPPYNEGQTRRLHGTANREVKNLGEDLKEEVTLWNIFKLRTTSINNAISILKEC